MGYKNHEGDRCRASVPDDAARKYSSGGLPRVSLRGLSTPHERHWQQTRASYREGFPAHFKEQVCTSESSPVLRALSHFAGSRAFLSYTWTSTAPTLEAGGPGDRPAQLLRSVAEER